MTFWSSFWTQKLKIIGTKSSNLQLLARLDARHTAHLHALTLRAYLPNAKSANVRSNAWLKIVLGHTAKRTTSVQWASSQRLPHQHLAFQLLSRLLACKPANLWFSPCSTQFSSYSSRIPWWRRLWLRPNRILRLSWRVRTTTVFMLRDKRIKLKSKLSFLSLLSPHSATWLFLDSEIPSHKIPQSLRTSHQIRPKKSLRLVI